MEDSPFGSMQVAMISRNAGDKLCSVELELPSTKAVSADVTDPKAQWIIFEFNHLVFWEGFAQNCNSQTNQPLD